jgi:phytoene synthase
MSAEPGVRSDRAPQGTGADILAAYQHCEAITRARAGNFYWGIRLLPARKRRAMCAVYAFARRVDDIGDGELEPAQKLSRLDEQARAVEALARPADAPEAREAGDPVMLALRHAGECFDLPPDALSELIEGVRMDVEGATYERFEDLLLYCRRVAGGIGRLCLAVFGVRAADARAVAEAQALADELGVAMQLTNILRDVREDAENARVYLPAEDLRRFGVVARAGEGAPQLLASLAREAGAGVGSGAGRARAEPSEAGHPSAEPGGEAGAGQAGAGVSALMRFEADRARQWFARGVTLAEQLDARSAACVLAMAGIYERLLERIAADPERALARRVSLPAWEKAWVAGGSLLSSAARVRRGHARAGVPIGGHG